MPPKPVIWMATLFVAAGLLPVHAGLHKGLKLVIDDTQRTYDLYVPSQAGKGKRPLLIMYHGHVGNSDVMTGENDRKAPYKLWLDIAERENMLVAIPNGEKGSDDNRGWNDCRADASTNPTTDDVRFSLKLIETIHLSYPVDRKRIYATGTSNGGNMVLRLAMEAPETFAAVAAVVANHPGKSECKARGKPVSVLFMNGTADPLLPYDGGRVGKDKHDRGTVLSTEQSVAYWIKVNGTTTKAKIKKYPDNDTYDKSTVERYRYTGGKQGTEVVVYKVIDGGHTEPSIQERYRRLYKWIVGNQNHDIEMADEVWAFFRGKTRR